MYKYSVKQDFDLDILSKYLRRYIAFVADTALSNNLI